MPISITICKASWIRCNSITSPWTTLDYSVLLHRTVPLKCTLSISFDFLWFFLGTMMFWQGREGLATPGMANSPCSTHLQDYKVFIVNHTLNHTRSRFWPTLTNYQLVTHSNQSGVRYRYSPSLRKQEIVTY